MVENTSMALTCSLPALAQTFDDYEIIIVNDGSSDSETNGILSDYHMPKTRVIHTDNQGLAAARNNGIAVAGGEFILPLDADDRIGPSYMEESVKVLDATGDIGIVYCKAQLFGAVETEWNLPHFLFLPFRGTTLERPLNKSYAPMEWHYQ